jgi:chemotaxis protein histidine kinase CheA
MSSTEVQENFTIFDHLDQPITLATWATANKESTFAAIFNIRKIKRICEKRGLAFQHCMIYRPDGTAALIGELKASVTPATSYYEARRKVNVSGAAPKSNKGNERSKRLNIEELDSLINDIGNRLKVKSRELSLKAAEIKPIKSKRKSLLPGQERLELYRQMKQIKLERNSLQSQVFKLRDTLKQTRCDRYEALQEKV